MILINQSIQNFFLIIKCFCLLEAFLFRFVSMLPKGTVFVVFCFLLRVVTALGGAAADTASFAIVAGEFGTNIGKVTVCKGYWSFRTGYISPCRDTPNCHRFFNVLLIYEILSFFYNVTYVSYTYFVLIIIS